MTEDPRQIIPCAIRPGCYETRECIDHSEQSALLQAGDLAIVLRPFGKVHGFSYEQEFARRVSSTRLFESRCPEVALPSDYVIMEGFVQDSPEQRVQLLIRSSPWIENARPMTVIPLDELTSERKVLADLADINRFVFLQGLRGRIYDVGLPEDPCNDSNPLQKLVRRLYLSNIMIGIDAETGARKVFFDPDWYSILSDPDHTPRSFRYYRRQVLIRSITAFTIFSTFEKVRKLQEALRRLTGS